MIDVSNDTSRKVTTTIATRIVEMFPESASDRIGDNIIGDGVNTLKNKIHSAIQYRLAPEDKKKRKSNVLHEESDNDPEKENKFVTCRKQDQYGCVAYAPSYLEKEKLKAKKSFAREKEKVEKLTNILQKVKDMSALVRCRTPQILAVYPLIIAHFNEEQNSFFIVFYVSQN